MPAAAQNCEVKIGTAGPMTGGGASWGLSMKAAVEFEAAMVNAEGGLKLGDRKCKVTVVPYDSLGTASGGAAAANYFASQNIHAINGPVVGPESTGWLPVGKRNGIVSFTSTFALNAMSPDFPLAFHMLQGPPIWGPVVVKAAKEKYNFKNAVLIGPNDQGGTDTMKPLQKMYDDAGVHTALEYYQRGTTNFSAIATRLMNINPDVVDFSGGPPGEMAVLAKQLLEAVLKRVERNAMGLPGRMFPVASYDLQTLKLAPPRVLIDPAISFGRPILASTGIRTSVIVGRIDAGEEPAKIAEDYGLEPEDLDAAIAQDRSLPPENVSQCIARSYRQQQGERVIAGSDCGFGTFAGYGKLDPDISFKKLRAMVEGAAIASARLW